MAKPLYEVNQLVWVKTWDDSEEPGTVLSALDKSALSSANDDDDDEELQAEYVVRLHISARKLTCSESQLRIFEDDESNDRTTRRSTRSQPKPVTPSPAKKKKKKTTGNSPSKEESNGKRKTRQGTDNEAPEDQILDRKRSSSPNGALKQTAESPHFTKKRPKRTALAKESTRQGTDIVEAPEDHSKDRKRSSSSTNGASIQPAESPHFTKKRPKRAALPKQTSGPTNEPLPLTITAELPSQELFCQPVAAADEQERNIEIVGNDADEEETDRPFKVSYAPTGRACCPRCDEYIEKGALRITHTPLFRGGRGFQVSKHLACAVFTEEVEDAQDVGGWSKLKTEDDLNLLFERVEESKLELEEEKNELKPDELIQTLFQGEIRGSPEGLEASLLPFQVEGVSWMYHQETKVPDVRGGILADEMGMGKTLQTITTILDNRPLLQHSKPGAKHPPSSADLSVRNHEESLWSKAASDWKHEVEMIGVGKGLVSKKNVGGRAGTLVVCPLIALSQWKTEIEKFTAPDTLSIGIYHGTNRAAEMPVAMMQKYDIVLTTYQVLEQDFRKMVSPNKVTCPNCGGKYKIDKLRVHLKYYCGEAAERTEAQARQRRNSDNNRRSAGNESSSKTIKSKSKKSQEKVKTLKVKSTDTYESESDLSLIEDVATRTDQKRPSRSAAKSASKKLSQSMQEWSAKSKGKATSEDDDDSVYSVASESEDSDSEDAGSGLDGSKKVARQAAHASSASLVRAKQRQAQALASINKKSKKKQPKEKKGTKPSTANKSKKSTKKRMSGDDSSDSSSSNEDRALRVASIKKKSKKKQPKTKKGMKPSTGKQSKKSAKKRKSGGDSSDSSSSDEDVHKDPMAGIDLEALTKKAMEGSQLSVLHSVCWWRVVLDEAHFIKSRSSQTSHAAFSLTSIHRWCLSGTPLQNRVGELYSLIRFLRISPMAHYFCRMKGCTCQSIHYRMKQGVCQDCSHRQFSHFSYFNKHVLTPIQRDGYTGDGRRAMFKLKTDVMDKCLLRRTKETKAEDMNLPPRIVRIKYVRLHPIEEDFYQGLYTQTKASFDDYVAEGTLLNNYAHIFDLLTKMRQAVDHPYLLVYSRTNRMKIGASSTVANGRIDCEMCHEPPTERVVSSCCGAGFCRSCVIEYIAGGGGESTPCPSCREPFTIDLNQKSVDCTESAALPSQSSEKDPVLKDLPHVATGSILRRINLAEFATSTKIEVLVQSLVEMRKERPGGKALVFSQFVNMLDLVRWRLHSDPFLSNLGLGVRILHGGMDAKSRDAALKDFREDSGCRVLLMSLKAAGVALNLTVASECYLLDLWWNPAAEMQAIDRCHRLGQHRPIRAVRFVAEGTVEERVLQLQEKKRLVFDGTVGRDAGSLKMLTANDMKSLFS